MIWTPSRRWPSWSALPMPWPGLANAPGANSRRWLPKPIRLSPVTPRGKGTSPCRRFNAMLIVRLFAWALPAILWLCSVWISAAAAPPAAIKPPVVTSTPPTVPVVTPSAASPTV